MFPKALNEKDLDQVKQSVPILCSTCRNIGLLCFTCQNWHTEMEVGFSTTSTKNR